MLDNRHISCFCRSLLLNTISNPGLVTAAPSRGSPESSWTTLVRLGKHAVAVPGTSPGLELVLYV